MPEPQDWGDKDRPFINAKGTVLTRETIEKSMPAATSHPTDHLGFDGWLCVCNAILFHRHGVGVFDLPDMTWRDWYDDRIPPSEAAKMAREEAETY